MKLGRATVTVVWLGLMISPAFGQTAGMLSFQGLIKDAGGDPISGSVDLTFRVYDADTGGTLKAGPFGPTTVTATNGIVSTKFGPVAPSAFDGGQRWLEVSIDDGGGPVPLSRIELATAPATAEQMNIPTSGNAAINIDATGNVGIGTDQPQGKLHVEGSIRLFDSNGTNTVFLKPDKPGVGGGYLELLNENGQRRATLQPDDSGWDNGWLQLHNTDGLATVFLTSSENMSDQSAVLKMKNRAGIKTIEIDAGGETPVPSHVNLLNVDGELTAHLESGESGVNRAGNLKLWNAEQVWTVFLRASEGAQQSAEMQLRNHAGEVTIELDAGDQGLGPGTITTQVLQITGGSDLAEPFAIAESSGCEGSAQSGMVMVIDPDNPGQLKLARAAYDRKVAGIISGANGLSPGMVMRAEGTTYADGEYNVALTGRVWC